MRPVFITGIGTGVGKTLISAIVAEALQALYWKPVQAGFDEGTDAGWVRAHVSGPVAPELYKLKLPASPHIAAREEGVVISLDDIAARMEQIRTTMSELRVVVEGAGGLLVTINESEFMLDMVRRLNAIVILVSRNYLGSINHSLLTAAVCRQHGLDVAGWIFNDHYGDYEEEIARWSGIPSLGSIPFQENPGKDFVQEQAARIRPALEKALG